MAKRKTQFSESAFLILSDVTLEGASRATDRAIFLFCIWIFVD